MTEKDRDKVWQEISYFVSSMPFKELNSIEKYHKGVLYYSNEEMEEEYRTTMQTFAKLFGKRQRFSALRPLMWGFGWDLATTRNPGKEYKFYSIYQ